MSTDSVNHLQEESLQSSKHQCSETHYVTDSDGEPSDIVPVEKRSSKTTASSLCEVCSNVPSKYVCPGCSLRTCSLPCVKEHKTKLDCTGERNKFAWVDISQYSDRHLLNDYRFLETAERSLYSNKIVPKNRQMGSVYQHFAPYQQSRRARLLISAAIKRGIRLRMMPSNLTKHKANTSFYTIRTDVIDWHIEWHFVSSNCLVKDEKVPETTILSESVKKFGNAVDYPHLRIALKDYRKNLQLCRYLIKVEGLPANRKRFIELKPLSTVASNLKGLSLVEHPTIFVLPPSYADDEFQLLDIDKDLSHMQDLHMRHLTSHHPDFSQTNHLEAQLLDVNSDIYQAEDVIDVDAE